MIEVTGEVSHILFQKDQFMIGKLKSKSQEFIFKGNILGIHKGDKLAIKGNLVNHPKYGEQVEVNEWEKPIPDSKDEAVKFLSSGLIKGVGRKRARAIVDKLGENAISIINDKGEEALEGIKGIKGKTLEGIVESVKETFEIQEIVAKLSVYGITIELVLKAYKVFEG